MKDGPLDDTIHFHKNVESTIQNSIEDETVHFPIGANGNIEKRSDEYDGKS